MGSGGGPAPGINSVIGAATIRSALQGLEVVGIQDGFEHLMRGDASHARRLEIEEVSRIHFRGGSILGTSRCSTIARAVGRSGCAAIGATRRGRGAT